jgi:uncharacterized membrane protein YdjX (TVP38/TMEM64 family)
MFETQQISPRTIFIGLLSFVALTLVLTIVVETIGAERLRAIVANAGALAPFLYLLVRVLTYIIAPLSSGPLAFSAGILFGLWPGVALTLVAEIIGGSANFWIARRFGRPVVARFVGRDGMGRIERFYMQASSPLMLIYARLFLFAIYDFISYTAGLTRLPYRHYLWITAVVGVVPILIAVGIGESMTGKPEQLVLMYAALAVIFTTTFLLYGRVRRLLKLDTIIPAREDA